jgi:vanadium chloroperoxidase
MSRIWLGVHWHFDAFAGETVCEPYTKGSQDGKDNNLPLPNDYQQLYKVEADGSTMYKDVKKMDWFAEGSKGPRSGSGPNEKFPVGGVPLGMMIADNIFGNKMRTTGVLTDLRKF